ncbi:hypothetical protein ACTFIZ_012328 [Dictyostelium cf. discoideum]
MSSILSHDSSNVDLELIRYLTESEILLAVNAQASLLRYLAESAIVLAVNAQASLSCVRRNNIAKEIYGSEVLLRIKIKDTPKMFDENETEQVRKLAKSIRKNNEAKQSLLKMNNHSKSNFKKSVNSSGNNTNGNSSNNSKSSSGSNGRSNNFNGSASNVASGSNNTKRTRSKLTSRWTSVPPQTSLERIGSSKLLSRGYKWIKGSSTPNFKPMPNPISISIPEGTKSDCITKEVQDLLADDAIEQVLPNRYSKSVFYSNVFKVPKPGTTLHRPVLDLKRNQESTINSQTRILHGKTRYQESLPPRVIRSTIQRFIPPLFLGLQIDYLSMKLLVPKEKKKSIIKEIRNFLKLDCCSPRKLAGLKGKLIALKDAVIPFRLYTRRKTSFTPSVLLSPMEIGINHSPFLKRSILNQWNGKEISLFPSYDYVLTALLMAYQALWWSDTRTINCVRTTLETIPQEESQLD